VPLGEPGVRDLIVQRFLEHDWLTCLHCHVGSVGCSMDLHAAGTHELVELAIDVTSRAGRQQVTVLDIGGGLPANYGSDHSKPLR
jgi:diaminopimelate decarboxylase